MTTRLLPSTEWPRLQQTLLAEIWPRLDPSAADVIVVEQQGQLLGSIALFPVLHAECVLTTGSVAVNRALWRAVMERAVDRGVRGVWGAAVDEPMQGILQRHATPVPGKHFVMSVVKE